MNFLNVSSVTKMEGPVAVVKEVSFAMPRLHKLAIAGETGSGKSSLLKIIAGLVQAHSGAVHFEGQKIKGPEEKLMPGHPQIAYLSQYFELLNNYYVEELLSYANELPEAEAQALYDVCRISHLVKRKTSQLSGGEKQRIALAKLLSTAPKLLLLDEPFSNLDAIHKNILKTVIDDISHKLGTTLIVVSHDPLDTLSWADTLLVMKDGALIQQGAPEAVYHRPVNHYVAALFGSYNVLNNTLVRQFKLNSIETNGSAFIRPEKINLHRNGEESVSGEVSDIRFYGSYYELTIVSGGESVKVRTLNNTFHLHKTVYMSIAENDVWYMEG